LPLGEKWKMLKKFTKMAILAIFETTKNWVREIAILTNFGNFLA
jgi:hypothetical protein